MAKLDGDWEQMKIVVNAVEFNVPTDSSLYENHWLTYDLVTQLFGAFEDAKMHWEELKSSIVTYANENLDTEEYPVPEIK